jgi:hypothetical protein
MMPIRRNYNQNWLPSIFNDFFDNDWMETVCPSGMPDIMIEYFNLR